MMNVSSLCKKKIILMIMIGVTKLTVCIIIISQLFAQHKMINDNNCDKSSSYLQNIDEIFSHFR